MRILSRSSALAVAQAEMVGRALAARWPNLAIAYLTRSSLGDRNSGVALWEAPEKGLFTADLSDALIAGEADLVVHSWKDLPIVGRPDTVVAGTLPRADVRDVLLVRRDVVDATPATLSVLTSSPRRAWQLQSSVASLLPWPVTAIDPRDVRGNIPTRLNKLIAGDADALVVAKAALDRLLESDARDDVRRAMDACRWMVLPVKECPAAPAQGALAIEVAASRPDVLEVVGALSHEPTRLACEAERAILRGYGGGCHEAIGATVLAREYGSITSVRGRLPDGGEISTWRLEQTGPLPPEAAHDRIWPRPEERSTAERRRVPSVLPADAPAFWVSRAEALPTSIRLSAAQIVWAAGTRTWRKLAARGILVNGCADGLGDAETPNVDLLAGATIPWHRLTHTAGVRTDSTATYEVAQVLPADLDARTHFYWTSGSLFLRALEQHPAIRDGWHASGPGHTSRVLLDALPSPDRVSIWLDYDAWLDAILT